MTVPAQKILPLEAYPALVLNADYTPLSNYPLSLWPWQTAVKAIFLDRVDVVAEYDREIRGARHSMRAPSVIALREYVKPSKYPAFTRFNVFLRDKFCCQYCLETSRRSELTFDHVIPRKHGGRTTWENIVTACQPCNSKKDSKSLKDCGMHLHSEPRQPTIWELQKNGLLFPPNYLHKTWHDYVYWDTPVLDDASTTPWPKPVQDLEPLAQPDRSLGSSPDNLAQKLVMGG